jgi:hypothetical protein
MVDRPDTFRWSSAACHAGKAAAPEWLEVDPLATAFTAEQWAVYLELDTISEAETELRNNTYTGRPVGTVEFIEWAESSLGRKLAPQTGGRPRKNLVLGAGGEQGELFL